MRIGSLFSGIGGLDLAVCEFFGADLAWVCEIEKAPSQVLTTHVPDAPNLGDITKVDWDEVAPVDIVCGGFPCQDISYAGQGRGIRSDTRSGLWLEFARCVRALRPSYVVVENVAALLTRGMGLVLGDLAEMGFDAEWCSLRASEVGAPHRRERIFIVAFASGLRRESPRVAPDAVGVERHARVEPLVGGSSVADASEDRRSERCTSHDDDGGDARRHVADGCDEVAADAGGPRAGVEGHRGRRSGRQPARARQSEVLRQGDGAAGAEGLTAGRGSVADPDCSGRGEHVGAESARSELAAAQHGGDVAADTDGRRRQQRDEIERGLRVAGEDGARVATDAERDGLQGREDPTQPSAGEPHVAWGAYEGAIRRWERVMGPAPAPVDDRKRLAPEFVEWMMGFPAGWIDGLSRTAALKALGNAVVPQQAFVALQLLATRVGEEVAS